VISAAHTDADTNQTIDAAAESPHVYAMAIQAGSTEGPLVGRPVAPAIPKFGEQRRLRPDVTTSTGGAS
jgi:glutamate-1-semialdehyde 2,1-aminomutase